MARYTGPRLRKMRRLGAYLPGLSRKQHDRRPYPPGVHGGMRRGKPSEYKIRLVEKQKLRFNYGVSEKVLRKYFRKAISSKLETGSHLAQLLERRLDNVVFRAGFAPTIPGARQLVNHGHIQVNGRKVDIASFMVKPGDVITLREKSKKVDCILESVSNPSLAIADFLDMNAAELTATMNRFPESGDIPFEIHLNLVVEHYSRLI